VDKLQTINVAIRSPSDILPANGNGGMLPILVGGAVVIAAGYWYFRMRKPKQGVSQK
jgi:hypothetical protein